MLGELGRVKKKKTSKCPSSEVMQFGLEPKKTEKHLKKKMFPT